jgi:hypothetical protein
LPTPTGAADDLFARACHRLPAPCSSAGCVDGATQRAVWEDAVAFYCTRFGGQGGGAAASQLAMLPLLREIVTRVQAAAAGAGHRVLLFSGHDTVVAPLLAALGGLQAPGACRWPPYASHIILELWTTRAQRAGPDRREQQHEVRVLFNGQPVTRYLTGCEPAVARARARSDLSSDTELEFCPLEYLVQTVDKLAQEFASTCRQ